MAKYMGKSSDEIWKLVMGNKQQSGQQEQTAAQTGAKTGASGGRYSGMSADDIWKSVMEGGGQETSQTGLGTASSDTGYQKWLRDYDTVSNKYYSWAKKNSGEGKWQADSFGGTKEAMESLLDQYDDISQRLDEKDKTQFQKAYDGLKQTYDALSESGKYYAQFRDQDDYDRARSGYTNFGVGYAAESYGLDDAQARALRQEQVQKDAREAQRALAEYVAAKKAFTPVDQEYRIHNKGDSDGGAYSDEYEEDLTSRYNQARAKVTAAENALLNAQNRMNAYKAGWGKIDQYAKYADAAKNEDTSYTGASFDEIKDYEYKLENEPIHSDREALAPAAVQDKYLSGWLAQNPEPNMDDSLGLWLSMTEEQREHAKLSSFPTLQTLWNTANDGLWDALNDTEIQTYYYLRHNQGQEAALQYLKDLNPELNRRTDEAFIETVQNASTAGRWGYEAAAYGLNLIGNVEAGVGELGEMITGNHNPYSNTSRAQRYAGYIRGINGQSFSKFAEDVAKNAGASEEFAAGAAKYAENTYQAITSGFDSAIGATVFGPAYLPIMGLGAMAQKSSDLELRGASNRQIAVGAVGAGCIEMLFEKVSLDHFFENFIKTPPKSWKELIQKTMLQAGIEGSEEINTEIANIAFDAINMGKNCDVSMSIREYMAQGLSEEEAKKRATVDAVTDIYWAGFGGFVSGGAMAGASGTAKMGLSKAANAMGNYDVGKPLLENGRVADLQQQAESLTDAKKSAKLSKAAQEVAYNASVGDNSLLNTYKTGKVASQIAREAGREASKASVTEFRNAAEKYLAGQRDIKNKKHALNVLTRAFEGTTTVPGDKAAMRRWGNQMTQEILEGIGGKQTLQENAKARAASAIKTAVDVQSSVLGFEPTKGETAFEYNQEGDTQAYLKDSSDPVNIRAEDPVAKIENGKMWLNTDDGQTVEVGNVSFGTAEDASLASIVSRMNITADQANSLYAARTESGMSAKSYATALQNAYLKGFSGVTYNGIQDYSAAAKLPGDVRRTAWEAGRQMRNRQTTEQAAKISKGTQMVNQRGLTFRDSAKSIRNLNEQQKTGIAAAKALAAAGLHIEVYASTEAERASGAPNGFYRSSDGTIHIDLNAGDNGQGTVAYVVAHEATHFIKDLSADKYQIYADILIEAAEAKGISYDSLLDRQLAKQSALEENRGKTAEELQELAYDETIAEMSETMLTDTDAAQRVSQELYKKDRTLWEKIRDFFTGLVEKLRSAYKGLDPDSDMGRITRQAIRDNEKVAQAWAEAVVEAGENYSAGQTGVYEDLGIQTEETSGAAQNVKGEELLQNTQQVEEAETAETETRSAETKTVSEGELSDTDKRRERLKDYLNEAWSKGDGSAELRDALQRMWSDEYNLNFRTDDEYRKYMEDTLPDLEAGDTKTIAQVRQDFAAPTAKFVHENRVNAERDAVRNLNMRNRAYENARNIYGENSTEANTAKYFVTDAEQKLQKVRGLNEGMYAALEGRNSEHERVTRRYLDLAYKEFYGREAAQDGQNYQLQDGTVIGTDGNSADYLYSSRVSDKKTLDFLDGQETVTTYKTMQLVDGKLYPPMAAVVAGSYEDYSELGKWEAATEHPELIKLDKSGKPKFTLNKGKGQGSLAAAYNPYMHSSNLVLNDQFSGAYTRPNLVTVECRVPVSELTSGYKAQYAKDSVGWHSWHTGTVAGALRQQTGTERQVLLSRWIMPVRIVPNVEVAQMYKQLLDGTDIAVPDNVVPPALLTELKKAGVAISESGRIQDGQKNNARGGEKYSNREAKKFSYDYFEQKSEAQITDINADVGLDRKAIRDSGIKSALQVGEKNQYGSVSVYVDDLGGNVIIGKDGVGHSLRRVREGNAFENYIVAANAGPIIKNSILVNELTPKKDNATGSYVLIGIARDQRGTGYIVESIVNKFSNELESMDVLYSMNAKKELAALNAPGATLKTLPVTSSDTSIPSVLRLVNDHFPDVLPEEVLKHYGYTERPAGKIGESALYSSRNARDSEYMELAKDPEGNREALSEMVKQAARDAGYTEVAYHGTHSDFTVFDKKTIGNNFGTVSDLGFYFTPYYEDARGFSTDFGKKGAHVLKGALRFSNPLVVEDTGWGSAIEQTDTRHGDLLRWAREGKHDGIIVRSLDDEFQDDDGNYDTVYVAFDSNQFKVLDPVTYDDSGNVIPLSQRFDTGNEDIRYSSRNNQESRVDRLARKNEELKAEAEYLKQVVQIQKQGNRKNLRDRESVNAIAKGILESVNAKDTEFGKKLNDFYRDLVMVEMDYDTMQERAGELADRVLEHHQAERDGYAQEVLDFLKKRRVSLTESQIGDAEYTYGSLSEFKKAIRGSIIIDQNSTTSLDQLWQEAAAQFPDRFDAETAAADMPDGIANVVSWATNAEADSETEFQYYKAETKADLTQKILMGFLDAKPIESVSDTLKQQMAGLKKQHQQEMKELRKSWDAEAKAMEQSHKYDLEAERKRGKAAVEALKYQQEVIQKAQKGLWETERADIKRSYQKQMKELREQNTQKAHEKVESRHRTEERHKLQNTVDTLNRMLLRPTNTSHVPQELQSSVAMAMKVINGAILDSKAGQNADRLAKYAEQLRTLEKDPGANAEKIADLNRKIGDLTGRDISMKAALNSLQEQYAKLEGQEGSLYDSNIEALIEDAKETIGNTAYKDLSLEQLKAVRDTYTALLTTIRNANKAFVAGQNARIDDMVKRATIELSMKGKKKPTQTAIGKKIDQFFWNNEKPVYAFERIGSAVMSELYRNLRNGEDTFYRDVNSAREFFLGAAEKNGFDKWNLDELQEFEASNGQKFQLSLDERMSLYAYSLRPQARDHLTKGGIVLAENTKRLQRGPLGVTMEVTYDDANAYTLTNDTIDAIVNSLTKEQQQFAYEMQQYLAKVMGAKGDEVNMTLYGIKKFGEETYWPLKSSGVFSERIREQQERTGNKQKNKGFTKALTQHANNAIELSSLTETWAEHVNDMSMYHAFTLPMEDFYRVYNWTQKGDVNGKKTMGVRQMIQQTAGKGAVTYIDQFLKDLNGGLRADPRETVSKAMLSGFKKAAVSASLSVAIQQPSAVGRALAYIEANYFVGSKVESAGGIKETWDQLKKYAAVAGLKEMGRFDVDMGQSTLEYIIGRNSVNAWGKFTDKVDELSGWLPEMADQVTWCGIWEAAKRKTAAQNPGLKGEALLQKAGELFTDTITRTQVYDSVFSRSANMRAKSGLMSMATAFMAEPTTTANMVEDAVRKFARGDKRMAGKMLSSVAVATVLNAALAAVVYAARDGDEDKTYWEKYMASLAGETVDSFNPLTYIPVLADINNLLLGYSIERTDMSLASDLITALKKITTLYGKYDDEWSDEKKKEWEKKVRDAWMDNVWMAGTVMGLPLKNVVRDVEAVINTAKNPSNGAEMSADTVMKAMKDSARKNFPILSWKADESSSDQLYKAITQGKDVLARRMKAQFGDEKKYESALLKGLRENDPRIKEAAQYAIDGKTPERVAIIRKIVAEGNYTQDQVIKAINQKANSMKGSSGGTSGDTPQKLYDYEEYVPAAANGLGYADEVRKELIRYQADQNQEKDGKLTRAEAEEAAEKTFKSKVKSETKDGYAAGELTEAQVRKVLTAAGVVKDDELDDLILQWDTELELGDEISWSGARYRDYAETIHPAGISADTYDSYIRAVSKLSSIDEDGDGKTDITKQEQVIEYIDSMPISDEQKDTLFQAEYPKARKSVLRKLPWR